MTVRVLLADDQALLRGAFRMLLDSADDITVVGEAGDGREAVGLTRELRPDDMRNAVTLAAKSLKVSPTELDAGGADATYLNVYDLAGRTTQTKRITGWLLNTLSDIQLASDRVFYRVTGGFLFPMTTIGPAPVLDLSRMQNLKFLPSLGDGQRIAWLDTSAVATDVVTRPDFAGTCEE
ncbi:hypothetical protein AB0L67_22340 [Streptomyces flaveolus]|uniref:hypothetical protein n=1 Tax=Streptomyces flaveolus TaxID=67297 RepID=UPI00343E0070